MFRFRFEILALFPYFVLFLFICSAFLFKVFKADKTRRLLRSILDYSFFIVVSFVAVSLAALSMTPQALYDMDFPSQWTMAFMALALTVVSLFVAYLFKTTHALVVGLFSFFVWWSAQASAWLSANGIETIYFAVGFVVIGALYYLIGYLHDGKFKQFSNLYVALGTTTMISALIFASIKPGLVMLGLMTEGASILKCPGLTTAFTLLVVLAAVAGAYGTRKKRISLYEHLLIDGIVALFVVIAVMSVQKMFISEICLEVEDYLTCTLSRVGSVWAALFNIVLLVKVLSLFFFGVARKSRVLINAGSFFFVLLILIKYFDWFFDDIPNTWLLFGGAVLVLVAVVWSVMKGRQRFLVGVK